MKVDLRELKPNPCRDFSIDPIDPDVVATLTKSIEDDGFWGGVVCRKKDDVIYVIAGHHRVDAALAAGITHADLFVADGKMDDRDEIIIYGKENTTQRGDAAQARAMAGLVAAAVRYIAKAVLGGDVSRIPETSEKAIDTIRGQLGSEKGIGQNVIVSFLDRVPGINNGVVQQALANIKASGDYGRIIGEVQQEIERENAEAFAELERAEVEAEAERQRIQQEQEAAEKERKEAEQRAKEAKEKAEKERARKEAKEAKEREAKARKEAKEAKERAKQHNATRKTRDSAKKAAENAAKNDPTFDFKGVSHHLRNSHQIDEFRKHVTGPGIAPYLPVENQAELAEYIVNLASERKRELTATFIRENVTSLVLNVKREERQLSNNEREKLLRQDMAVKAKEYQSKASAYALSFAGKCNQIRELLDKFQADNIPFPVTSEFRNSIDSIKKAIDLLHERI